MRTDAIRRSPLGRSRLAGVVAESLDVLRLGEWFSPLHRDNHAPGNAACMAVITSSEAPHTARQEGNERLAPYSRISTVPSERRHSLMRDERLSKLDVFGLMRG